MAPRKRGKVAFTDGSEEPARFMMLPDWVVTDLLEELSKLEIATYLAILRWARPIAGDNLLSAVTRAELSESVGSSERTVQRAIGRLVDLGAIVRANSPTRGVAAEYLIQRRRPPAQPPPPDPAEEVESWGEGQDGWHEGPELGPDTPF